MKSINKKTSNRVKNLVLNQSNKKESTFETIKNQVQQLNKKLYGEKNESN